jgi:hypothetical protein
VTIFPTQIPRRFFLSRVDQSLVKGPYGALHFYSTVLRNHPKDLCIETNCDELSDA